MRSGYRCSSSAENGGDEPVDVVRIGLDIDP